ncbi:MAG: putative ABC transporter permease [Erysipelotrichaceae bacterium]|nr:putative ABC transporter permease [Erysipelotrichaceae bacterium]
MISRFMIYFILLSILGYFYECAAMTIWAGKWENRGFLYGPAIPIYGAGALFGTILFECFYTVYTPLSVFLISMFASAVLEYVVHYALEQAFHAYWWDYSNAPLNINGRICLPASIGFGVAGLIIVYVINPFLLPILNSINGEICQLIALIFMGVFAADLTVTICVIGGFIRRVENAENFLNEHMDSLVSNFLDESKAINYRFYSAVDKVEERRKKMIDARFERIADSYTRTYRRIISGVKGFRGNRYSIRLNEALTKIKNRMKRTKDE